ncbi:MAG: hypothetical protein EOQ30_31125 [Mesorhizobium sp.]|nr:MAG: hypothetical protein EOQ30_31125 [Mesorhizobium sp.]
MGGDRTPPRLSPIANVAGRAPSAKLPISPLVGEMSGRPEGARRIAAYPCFGPMAKVTRAASSVATAP